MRPRGETRQALTSVLERLHSDVGAVSAQAVASAAHLAFEQARETMKDMTRAGEIVVAGRHTPPGERWHNLYEPAGQTPAEAPSWSGIQALLEVMRSFPARQR